MFDVCVLRDFVSPDTTGSNRRRHGEKQTWLWVPNHFQFYNNENNVTKISGLAELTKFHLWTYGAEKPYDTCQLPWVFENYYGTEHFVIALQMWSAILFLDSRFCTYLLQTS